MSVIINGVKHLNLEEQVEYNKNKSEELDGRLDVLEETLTPLLPISESLSKEGDILTVNEGLDVNSNGDVTVGKDLEVEGKTKIGNVTLEDVDGALEVNGEEVASIDYVDSVAGGSHSIYVIQTNTGDPNNDNDLFESMDDTLEIPLSAVIVDINGVTLDLTNFKVGDQILLTTTGFPDRWFSGTATPNLRFQILESKADLTGYATESYVLERIAEQDADVVHNTGTENVGGTKTFTDGIKTDTVYAANGAVIAQHNANMVIGNSTDNLRLVGNEVRPKYTYGISTKDVMLDGDVSGVTDGTNWTQITIKGVTSSIPAGGGGGIKLYKHRILTDGFGIDHIDLISTNSNEYASAGTLYNRWYNEVLSCSYIKTGQLFTVMGAGGMSLKIYNNGSFQDIPTTFYGDTVTEL